MRTLVLLTLLCGVCHAACPSEPTSFASHCVKPFSGVTSLDNASSWYGDAEPTPCSSGSCSAAVPCLPTTSTDVLVVEAGGNGGFTSANSRELTSFATYDEEEDSHVDACPYPMNVDIISDLALTQPPYMGFPSGSTVHLQGADISGWTQPSTQQFDIALSSSVLLAIDWAAPGANKVRTVTPPGVVSISGAAFRAALLEETVGSTIAVQTSAVNIDKVVLTGSGSVDFDSDCYFDEVEWKYSGASAFGQDGNVIRIASVFDAAPAPGSVLRAQLHLTGSSVSVFGGTFAFTSSLTQLTIMSGAHITIPTDAVVTVRLNAASDIARDNTLALGGTLIAAADSGTTSRIGVGPTGRFEILPRVQGTATINCTIVFSQLCGIRLGGSTPTIAWSYRGADAVDGLPGLVIDGGFLTAGVAVDDWTVAIEVDTASGFFPPGCAGDVWAHQVMLSSSFADSDVISGANELMAPHPSRVSVTDNGSEVDDSFWQQRCRPLVQVNDVGLAVAFPPFSSSCPTTWDSSWKVHPVGTSPGLMCPSPPQNKWLLPLLFGLGGVFVLAAGVAAIVFGVRRSSTSGTSDATVVMAAGQAVLLDHDPSVPQKRTKRSGTPTPVGSGRKKRTGASRGGTAGQHRRNKRASLDSLATMTTMASEVTVMGSGDDYGHTPST